MSETRTNYIFNYLMTPNSEESFERTYAVNTAALEALGIETAKHSHSAIQLDEDDAPKVMELIAKAVQKMVKAEKETGVTYEDADLLEIAKLTIDSMTKEKISGMVRQ